LKIHNFINKKENDKIFLLIKKIAKNLIKKSQIGRLFGKFIIKLINII